MFTIALFTIGLALSSREEKTTGEKIEEGADEIGDAVEDATDDN